MSGSNYSGSHRSGYSGRSWEDGSNGRGNTPRRGRAEVSSQGTPRTTPRSSTATPRRQLTPPAESSALDTQGVLFDWLEYLIRTNTIKGDVHVNFVQLIKDTGYLDIENIAEALEHDPLARQYIPTGPRRKVMQAWMRQFGDRFRRDSVADAWDTLGRKAQLRFKNLQSCFRHLHHEKGIVTHSDFHRFLSVLNLPPDEAERIWQSLTRGNGSREDARVLFDDVCSNLTPFIVPGYPRKTEQVYSRMDAHADSVQARMPQILRDAIQRFADKIQQRFRTLREFFLHLDKRRIGNIARQDCLECFEWFNLPRDDALIVYEFLDRDNDGGVSYAELLNLIGPFVRPDWQMKSTPPEKEDPLSSDVRQAYNRIGKRVEQRFKTVTKAFHALTGGKNLWVTPQEFERWIVSLGLSEDDADIVFNELDRDRKGVVSFNQIRHALGPYILPGYTEDLSRIPRSRMQQKRLSPELRRVLQDWGFWAAEHYGDTAKAFKAMNADLADGIDKEECAEWCMKYMGWSKERAEELFEFLDEDDSGSVTWDEISGVLGEYIDAYFCPLGSKTYIPEPAGYHGDGGTAENTPQGSRRESQKSQSSSNIQRAAEGYDPRRGGHTPRSGTPRSGTPRSGTPRSGTPRCGTPRSSGNSGRPFDGTMAPPDRQGHGRGQPRSITPMARTPSSAPPSDCMYCPSGQQNRQMPPGPYPSHFCYEGPATPRSQRSSEGRGYASPQMSNDPRRHRR
eukprot:TRINITY_DN725_c0_g1_i1.p1 TRINITY_DN725_c0_g1~~TRINITY_DN725_c0_g1_i1.p1  ORF type:complete len:735 (+),score=76.52 TRINITY_DN725_c0_g1_i1:148-2352(+)